MRFHDLRHTAATLLLGHADIAITLRVYAHISPHMQQAAVDVMQRVFGRRGA